MADQLIYFLAMFQVKSFKQADEYNSDRDLAKRNSLLPHGLHKGHYANGYFYQPSTSLCIVDKGDLSICAIRDRWLFQPNGVPLLLLPRFVFAVTLTAHRRLQRALCQQKSFPFLLIKQTFPRTWRRQSLIFRSVIRSDNHRPLLETAKKHGVLTSPPRNIFFNRFHKRTEVLKITLQFVHFFPTPVKSTVELIRALFFQKKSG